MKRRIVSLIAAAALMAISASPAMGAPGELFPEQPGTHVANACESILTSPGVSEHAILSPTAQPIVAGLINDACFGG